MRHTKTERVSIDDAVFFYVDIVDSSDRKLPAQIRADKIQTLNEFIKHTVYYESLPARKGDYVSPAGDGMAIVFPSNLTVFQKGSNPAFFAAQLAITLHKKLQKYNRYHQGGEQIKTRIGISKGEVQIIDDILNNKVHSGWGMIMASRIMEIGNENHILLSYDVKKALGKAYRKFIHPIGNYTFKHCENHPLFSLYSNIPQNRFGNRDRPSNVWKDFPFHYHVIKLRLFIPEYPEHIVHVAGNYLIENTSNCPHEIIKHYFPKEASNINVYDERDGKVNYYPMRNTTKLMGGNEYLVIFDPPVLERKRKIYSFEFDCQNRGHYNHFFVHGCDKFEALIEYPASGKLDSKIDPRAKLMNENEKIVRRISGKLIDKTTKGGPILSRRYIRKEIPTTSVIRFCW